jgi:hypothetical protein
LNIPRLWKFVGGDLGGILIWGFFLNSSRPPRILEKYNMPCHAMHPMQDLFWKVFHMYGKLIFYHICTPMLAKFDSCKKWVLQIAMNLGCPEMAKLDYIEGHVPVLGLDHFVHAHILHEEPNHSLSVLYGRKVIWLPNPALRLYSCENLTL